jgi:hypothetical protein
VRAKTLPEDIYFIDLYLSSGIDVNSIDS